MADGSPLTFKCWSCSQWFDDIPAHWEASPGCRRPHGNLGPLARAESEVLRVAAAGLAAAHLGERAFNAPGVDPGGQSKPAPGAGAGNPDVNRAAPLKSVGPLPIDRKAYRREWMRRKRAKKRESTTG
jgi:hypothetical protein